VRTCAYQQYSEDVAKLSAPVEHSVEVDEFKTHLLVCDASCLSNKAAFSGCQVGSVGKCGLEHASGRLCR
jgi:hypothetical protein